MQFAIPAESVAGAFGNGSDGDVVLPSFATTTLTRDMKYRNLSWLAQNNTILKTNGFIVQVSGILSVQTFAGTVNTGINNDAAGIVPGGTGTLYGGAAPPAALSTNGNSPPGNGVTGVIGGGNGQNSSGGQIGGTVTPSGLIIPGPDLIDAILTGGGSGASGTAGTAGAGGGVVLLIANQIQITGTNSLVVSARGSSGAGSATPGAGGGGVIVIATGTPISGPLTTDVTSVGLGNPGKAFIIPISS